MCVVWCLRFGAHGKSGLFIYKNEHFPPVICFVFKNKQFVLLEFVAHSVDLLHVGEDHLGVNSVVGHHACVPKKTKIRVTRRHTVEEG